MVECLAWLGTHAWIGDGRVCEWVYAFYEKLSHAARRFRNKVWFEAATNETAGGCLALGKGGRRELIVALQRELFRGQGGAKARVKSKRRSMTYISRRQFGGLLCFCVTNRELGTLHKSTSPTILDI